MVRELVCTKRRFPPVFADRADAGRRLGARLVERSLGTPRPAVLGLPRGGVAVGYYVALALDAPLDVVLVRKLGVPWQPELAFGAISEGGFEVIDADTVRIVGLGADAVASVEGRERIELARRASRYRHDRQPLDIGGRTAIVVDDGIATGATARVACRAARARGAARVVLAVPVAPADAGPRVAPEVDEFVCLATPPDFYGVGRWYDDFTATTDADVMRYLQDALSARPPD
jgi:putative phosphoribosyl transferase